MVSMVAFITCTPQPERRSVFSFNSVGGPSGEGYGRVFDPDTGEVGPMECWSIRYNDREEAERELNRAACQFLYESGKVARNAVISGSSTHG